MSNHILKHWLYPSLTVQLYTIWGFQSQSSSQKFDMIGSGRVRRKLRMLIIEGLKAGWMIDLDWNMSVEFLPELTVQHNGDVYKDLYVWMPVWRGSEQRHGGEQRELVRRSLWRFNRPCYDLFWNRGVFIVSLIIWTTKGILKFNSSYNSLFPFWIHTEAERK